MGVEIEAKMRLTDRDDLVGRLSTLGATRRVEMFEVNTYFDTPDGSLRSSDRALRLRVESPLDRRSDTVSTLTYKGPHDGGELKCRTEIEVVVASTDLAAGLLRGIGFVCERGFEKHRRRWELDGCFVDIDTLPHLGDFVEIEGPSQKAVFQARQRLGLAQTPLLEDSYIALLEAYLAEKQIAVQCVAFDPPL